MDELESYLQERQESMPPEHNLYMASNVPSTCPWYDIAGLPVVEMIDSIFAPIDHKLPQTVARLKTDCERVCFLEYKAIWYLVYELAIDSDGHRNWFCGGTPNRQPELPESAKAADWTLPDELGDLYAVHDGFGELWPLSLLWTGECVRPARELSLVADHLIIESSWSASYRLEDLLEFYPDGAGNGQCFFRKHGDVNGEETVDWDHEAREISKPKGFWQFVDLALSNSTIP